MYSSVAIMHNNTATVVLEGPRGENRTIENVESVTTADDGTITVEHADEAELEEVGWDWTIRDVYVTWGPASDVSEGDTITYTHDGSIESGEVVEKQDDEIRVKQHPDGWMVAIAPEDIIPV
jgi:hypothetical protein